MISEILTRGTIALDANVLLALYRAGVQQRSELLSVLRQVSSRLWVPHQAALEYQRNRLKVASEQELAYKELRSTISSDYDSVVAEAAKQLGKLKEVAAGKLRDKELKQAIGHSFEKTVSLLLRVANERKDEMGEEFEKIRNENSLAFADIRFDDPIRRELDSILTAGHVGERPDDDTLQKRNVDARIEGLGSSRTVRF